MHFYYVHGVPRSVKLAIRKFSAAGPNIRLFLYGPPYGIFIHPLVPLRKQEQLLVPNAECFLMANFTLHGHSQKWILEGFLKHIIFFLHPPHHSVLSNMIFFTLIMKNIFSHYSQICLFILIKGSLGIKAKPSLKVLIKPDIQQSKPIKLKDFSEHYRIMSADSNFGFSKEYEELKRVGREKPCTAADMPVNQPKNRYSDILPYDHSR
jgi:hypothetical protein